MVNTHLVILHVWYVTLIKSLSEYRHFFILSYFYISDNESAPPPPPKKRPGKKRRKQKNDSEMDAAAEGGDQTDRDFMTSASPGTINII